MSLELFPLRDLRTLFWLRWRQFQDGAVYWLRLLGYEPGEGGISQKIYVVYLLGIGSIWLFAMWAWGFDISTQVGENLAPQTLADILNLIPLVVLAIQVWAIMTALRSTPLKLTFADMAYVAGSPMARSVPVLLGFVRQVLFRSVVFGALWALLTVLLLGPFPQQATSGDSLRVIVVIALLVVFTWATAWVLGILRLVYPRVSRWPLLWALPLLLFGVAYVMPDWVLWPGRAIILVVYGLAPAWLIPLIALLAIGLTVFFVWMGNRINMIQAVDESIVHARLAALGLLAYRMPDLQLRIRRQEAQAGRKPRLNLPRAYGQSALVVRSLVSYVRHPVLLLFNLAWGAIMTYVAVLILQNNLPVQLWIGWLLIAGVTPPVGLLHTFRMDMNEPFLRQFIPLNGFQILVADIALPLAFLILGALGVWFVQGFPLEILSMGLLFIPLLSFLLALCGAYAMTTQRELQARLIATGISFGLAAVAAVGLETPYAGLGVVLFAMLIFMGLLAQEA